MRKFLLTVGTGLLVFAAGQGAWGARVIDSHIDINSPDFAADNDTSNHAFPDPYSPTGQVDTGTGTVGWHGYTGSGSVFNQAIGLGWGPSDPVVRQSAPGSDSIFAFHTGTNSGGFSQIVQDGYDITGVSALSLRGRFKTFKQGGNNPGTQAGPALLSVSFGNGVGVAIETVKDANWNVAQPNLPEVTPNGGHFTGDGQYHYMLVLYNHSQDNDVALKDLGIWSADGQTADPNYETAILHVVDNGNGTDSVSVNWNGVTVYSNLSVGPLVSGASPAAGAFWGQGTVDQPGGGNTFVPFTDIRLTTDSVPEPASLGLFGMAVAGLVLRRRPGYLV